MTEPSSQPTLRGVAKSSAISTVLCAVPFAIGLAVFSEFGPIDGEFWLIMAAAFASGFVFTLPIAWIFDSGSERTGWGRLVLVTLALVPLQLVYLAAQGDVSNDHFIQFSLMFMTIGGLYSLLALTEFWRRWLPSAQRETPSAVLIVADTAVMLLVLTMSFGALTAVLEGLGAVKTEPDLDNRAIWDSEVFFAWQFWDSIPELEVPDTLGWKKPYETADAFGGALILLYKLLVILPVLAAVTDLWRRERTA